MADEPVSHTPGPWTARQEYANRWRIEAACEPDMVPLSVALVTTTVLEVGTDSKDTAANARLIAAAPDLLEAVRLLLPLAKGYAPAGQSNEARRHCNELCDFAETVRAKTEGRS